MRKFAPFAHNHPARPYVDMTLTALALLNCPALRCQRSGCKYFPACRSIGKQLVQFLRKEFPNATVTIRRGHPNEAMVMMARGT
jgi:hypothetical protein